MRSLASQFQQWGLVQITDRLEQEVRALGHTVPEAQGLPNRLRNLRTALQMPSGDHLCLIDNVRQVTFKVDELRFARVGPIS
eukprot:2778749-Rhodomonas_salina.1